MIEGELTEANLGLDGADLRWISRHCRSVIHNAANLTFHSNGREGEPWRSNFDGTRRILELCRTTGIRQFHYISTAYVCGLREGRVLETELDVGQTPGNSYEHSKIEAEKLVLATPWIDPPTIYRPAIIVGDSQTGYTATFHGFYVLVKLAHTLVSRMVRGSTAGWLMVESLGLSGKEHKNLVPVDWVSAVFTCIFSQPKHHGRSYHLVSSRPPSLGLIADVIQQAVEAYSRLANENDAFLTIVSDDGSIYSDVTAENTFPRVWDLTLAGGSTYTDNEIDILGTYGGYAVFAQIQNTGSEAVKVRLNGSATAIFDLSGSETQVFNAGELSISMIQFDNSVSGASSTTVQVLTSVKSVCNS